MLSALKQERYGDGGPSNLNGRGQGSGYGLTSPVIPIRPGDGRGYGYGTISGGYGGLMRAHGTGLRPHDGRFVSASVARSMPNRGLREAVIYMAAITRRCTWYRD